MMFDFYEKSYYAELDRRFKLYDEASKQFVVAGVYGTVVAFGSSKVSFSSPVLGAATVLLIGSTYFIARFAKYTFSFYGADYVYVDLPLNWLRWHRNLARKGISPRTSSELFEKHLIYSYARCASRNRKANDRKSVLLSLAQRYLMAALFFSVSAAILYVLPA